jgi:tryptophan synthase alpha chain
LGFFCFCPKFKNLLAMDTHPISKIPLMAHLVLGYPTLAESLRTAEAYVRAGVEILELQIPFSHPTADGPVITVACQEAVRQGVTVQDCLEAIRGLRATHPAQEIMVMSYVNRVYSFGFQAFVREMAQLDVRHLIIPDLPVDAVLATDSVEYSAVKLVPVLAANVSDERLGKLLDMGFDFFYLMSDFKITGSGFGLHPRLQEVIATIKKRTPMARVGIGFGISTAEQARLVAGAADVAIVGSALIQAQREGRLEAYLEEMKSVFAAKTVVD